MGESYFQSLQRENRTYALRVETLEMEIQRLEIEAEEKDRIMDSLSRELLGEEHKVNRLLKGEALYSCEICGGGNEGTPCGQCRLSTDPNISFEVKAHAFLRETGYLAPGKSVPFRIASESYETERQTKWAEWVKNMEEVQNERADS